MTDSNYALLPGALDRISELEAQLANWRLRERAVGLAIKSGYHGSSVLKVAREIEAYIRGEAPKEQSDA